MRWAGAWSRALWPSTATASMFLGASVPAAHLAEFLEMQQPLALALSCSMPTALVGVARSVEAAHDLGIPVVGGGRALSMTERAMRLGLDAHAHVPADAVDVLRSWSLSPPSHLAEAPSPVPERGALLHRSHTLVAAALEAITDDDTNAPALGEELQRVLQIVESALLVEEAGLIDEHVQWLLESGPAHGFERAHVRAALCGAGRRDGRRTATRGHRVACGARLSCHTRSRVRDLGGPEPRVPSEASPSRCGSGL